MDQTVVEGNHVVLMKNFDSENMKIIPVLKDTIVHYGKLHFDPSPLIGSKYGSVFEISDGSMIKVENFDDYDIELSTAVTNRMLTYNEKSQFSKEKLLKKKKKQNHANVVTVMRPSLRLVNEMFYARDKVGGLRLDTLAQILTLSNIQNGSKCLLLDHNLGLLTCAVMSRILPDGVCIQLVPDIEYVCTTRKTLGMLNIDEAMYHDKLLAITVRDFYKVQSGEDSFSYDGETMQEEHQKRLAKLANHTFIEREADKKVKLELGEETINDLKQTLIKKHTNRVARNNERIKAASYIKNRSLDSLILIAQNDHPLPLLKLSFPHLANSRQFVIYSDTIEPLLECHQYLKSNSLAVSLSLTEPWLRKYQVLPDRTRPEMNMSGYGGYLLSGIKAALYKSF